DALLAEGVGERRGVGCRGGGHGGSFSHRVPCAATAVKRVIGDSLAYRVVPWTRGVPAGSQVVLVVDRRRASVGISSQRASSPVGRRRVTATSLRAKARPWQTSRYSYSD